MQTETQENLPLKEVSAGEPYRVRRVAPRANNLIDGSRHGSVECFTWVYRTSSMHYRTEFWRSVLNEIEASDRRAIHRIGGGVITAVRGVVYRRSYDVGRSAGTALTRSALLVVALGKARPRGQRVFFRGAKIRKAASEHFRVARSPCCS
jgi:hypothetical protein